MFTFHVLLALIHDEGIPALSLLWRRIWRCGDILYYSNSLDRTVAPKLALEVI